MTKVAVYDGPQEDQKRAAAHGSARRAHADMLNSLRTRVLPLPDATAVLPGHGPQTTMARERAVNPYLQPDRLPDAQPPSRTSEEQS